MKIITTLIVLIIVVCAWFISSASADNVSNVDICIKEKYLAWSDGEWSEVEYTYPWEKCYNLSEVKQFDGFAFGIIKRPDEKMMKEFAKKYLLEERLRNNNIKNKTAYICEIENLTGKMSYKDAMKIVTDNVVKKSIKNITSLSSFGGMFVDVEKGHVYVYLKDKNDKKYVKDIIKPYKGEGVNVIFLKANYTIVQLEQWRKNLENLNKYINVTGLETNEIQNKVIIFVERIGENEIRIIEKYMEGVGIPKYAVGIRKGGERIEERSRTDKYRPIIGGVEMQVEGYSPCTSGFPVRIGSQKGYITAGHCTGVGKVSYQPYWANGNEAGVVKKKALPESGYKSDSAWIEYSSVILGEFFCYPDYNCDIEGKTSSYNQYIGEPICKSGYVTGVTCDKIQSKFWCGPFNGRYQYVIGSYYRSESGDSGAPVYDDSGSRYVNIYGIHKGYCNPYKVYSPIDSIENDLGTIYPW